MLLLIAGLLVTDLHGSAARIAGTVLILISAVLNGIFIYRAAAGRKT
ncbi:MAG TPA: hypothetical protein VMF29_03755 [Candidatus Edwardsbacteria bacterium]|nr:hypothetical protein [Candidatus Edwardsbacteria bacterium]